MMLPMISSLYFVIFNKNILNPLRLVRQQQQRQQREHQPQQQYTTSFLQNHKTKPLQQSQRQKRKQQQFQQRQQQQEQEHRCCHINCLGDNYNKDDDDDYNNNNNDNNCNGSSGGYDVDKVRLTAKTTALRRKLPCKRNKNEIQNSHSYKCQRHVIIATNTNTDSATNGINTNDMRHVLR